MSAFLMRQVITSSQKHVNKVILNCADSWEAGQWTDPGRSQFGDSLWRLAYLENGLSLINVQCIWLILEGK